MAIQDDIIDAISELSSSEELARVSGEALKEIVKRGALKELFEMLDSLEEEIRTSIRDEFRLWASQEQEPEEEEGEDYPDDNAFEAEDQEEN